MLHVAGKYAGGEMRLRATKIEALDQLAETSTQALHIDVESENVLPTLAGLLHSGGRGEVTLFVRDLNSLQAVEIALPQRYQVTPALAGAVAALGGVSRARIV